VSRSRRIAVGLGIVAAAIAATTLLQRSFPRGRVDSGADASAGASPAVDSPRLSGLRADEKRVAAPMPTDEPPADPDAPTRFRGRVVAPDGHDLPQGVVVVTVPGERGSSSDPVPWDSTGRFDVAWMPESIPPGARFDVHAAALGWRVVWTSVRADSLVASEVTLRLVADGAFSGRVVDDRGFPVRGLLLAVGPSVPWKAPASWPALVASARKPSESEAIAVAWTRTDTDGRFHLHGISQSTFLESVGESPVWSLDRDPIGEEGEDATTWRAVPGFLMQAHAVGDGVASRSTFAVEIGVASDGGDVIRGAQGGVGRTGWFRSLVPRARLPSGRIRVKARLLSLDCEPWTAEKAVELGDDHVSFEVPLRLRPPDTWGRVHVVVPVVFAGRTVSLARRIAPSLQWWGLRAREDDPTAFDIPTGTQEVKVSLDGAAGRPTEYTATVTVERGEEARIRPDFLSGSLRIRVPAGGANSVEVRGNGGRATTHAVGEGEDLLLVPVSPGTYVVSTTGRDRRDATVEASRETLVDLGKAR
jgi:hypothetical protein